MSNGGLIMKRMCYQDRLHEYEKEKTKLRMSNLSDRDYEIAIKKLADKWRI